MAKDDLSLRVGHRDRLRQKFVDGKLTDAELLELLLGCVIPRRDVRPLARGLMDKFGKINQILTTPMDDLMSFPGMGRNTSIFLKVINEIMVKGYQYEMKDKPIFHDFELVRNYCLTHMSDKVVEELHVLYLGSEMELIQDELHCVGTINRADVYPREILKRALNLNARAVALLHNHPAQHSSFSTDDVNFTTNLIQILRTLDIEFYDHLLVSGGVLHSMRSEMLLEKA